MTIDARFPSALQCLFSPKRYIVLWGGRGAGRSWGVARALLLLGTEKPIRILCARELQKSISESVHKLLSDQIEALGLAHFYDIQKSCIIGVNGTTIVFEGIKNNVSKIKSYEGINICWVEEANKVSKASWRDLIPSIRGKDKATGLDYAHIWVTFNPELDTDYTYKRFVKNPNLKPIVNKGSVYSPNSAFESEDSIVIKMTWRDNPWFPQVLKDEMFAERERDYDSYLNIWEGHCLQLLEGAIFAKELRETQEDGRICKVPWDRDTPVNTYWDLGRRDMTCIWFIQRVAMQYRVLNYFEGSQQDINFYIKTLQNLPYSYGVHYLPHDARNKLLGSKYSIEQQLRHANMGNVLVIDRPFKKVNPINAARLVFPSCWFDEDNTTDGMARLRRYSYAVKDNQLSLDPKHDEASNAADAFMTFAQSVKHSKEDTQSVLDKLKHAAYRATETVSNGLGWMS